MAKQEIEMVLIARSAAKNTLMKTKRQKNGTQKITFALVAEKSPYTETKSNVWLANKNTTIFKKFIGRKIG